MSRCFKTGESCQLKNVKRFKLCTHIAKTVCKLNVETSNPFINILLSMYWLPKQLFKFRFKSDSIMNVLPYKLYSHKSALTTNQNNMCTFSCSQVNTVG